MMKRIYLCILFFFMQPCCIYAWTSFSIYSKGRYNEKSSHLSYANPEALKGGTLHLAFEGSFDSLNIYSVKGYTPFYLPSVIQTLGQKTLDESDSFYPQVAEDFILAPDGKSMRVRLFKDAKFSDGHPVRSEDLAFSFALLRSEEADPHFRSYWSEITELKILSPLECELIFRRPSREIPALVTEIPVLPKHIYERGHFSKDFAFKLLGSGPYMLERVEAPSRLVFKRNPDFWAKDHVLNKGRYNFDRIVMEFYRDQTPLVEAFKRGSFDFYPVYIMKTWERDLVGEKFNKHWIVKELWPHQSNQGAAGYYFNLRKVLFQDPRVRKAITLAFDFPWTNRTLFHNEYLESKSLFENSIYKAKGLPDKKEKAFFLSLQKQFPNAIPQELFTEAAGYLGKDQDIEKRLSFARELLKDAGYSFQNGVLRGAKNSLHFRLLLTSHSGLRMAEPFKKNLARLGIRMDLEFKDRPSSIQKLLNRDFDLISFTIPSSSSPGQELMGYWSSAEAEQSYSRNHTGLSNPAVDKILDRVVSSRTREDLIFSTRSLDRLIYHLHLAVPQWYVDKYRVAFWNRLGLPSTLPLYFFENERIEFMWWDPLKEKRLQEAMKKGEGI